MVVHDFQKVELFAGTIRDAEVTQVLQTAQGPHWRVEYALVGRLGIQRVHEAVGVIHCGATRASGALAVCPVRGRGSIRCNGSRVSPHSVVVFGPHADFCISTTGEAVFTLVHIPNDALAECIPRHCGELREFSGPPTSIPGPLTDLLQSSFRSDDGQPRAVNENGLSPEDELLRGLTPALVAACQPPAVPPGRQPVSRKHLIRQALEAIEHTPDFHPSVEELADAAHVSRRTLFNAFNDYFGIGPQRYMRLRLLHAMHDTLRLRTATSVTTAAARFEVWDTGRLARDYSQLFGEYPSETLNRHEGGTMRTSRAAEPRARTVAVVQPEQQDFTFTIRKGQP
jgi:AraC family ethanolamine operon transcriptional activator